MHLKNLKPNRSRTPSNRHVVVLNPVMRAGYSGPTLFMQRLFGALAKKTDYRITAIGHSLPSKKVAGVAYKELSYPISKQPLGQLAWSFRATSWLVRNRKKYDVIHLHGAYLYNLMPSLALILLGIPYLILPLSANGDLSLGGRTNRFGPARYIRALIVRHAASGIAIAGEIEDELRAWGMLENQIYRFPNPVATEYFDVTVDSKSDNITMVFVGKLGPGKRPDLVLQALSELVERRNEGVSACFIGPMQDSAYEEFFLEEIVTRELTSRVDLVGFTDDVSEILEGLERPVFVLPSSQEGMPAALAETMAAGLPAVVTSVGAMGDVILESGAGFITDQDAEMIADLAEAICGDLSAWEDYSRRARSFARSNFSPAECAKQYEEILEKVWH